jgi:membrane-bound lytic murein transglycosylase MltF
MEDIRPKKKRTFTAEQKEAIVKGIQECATVREGLSKYNISSTTYYNWKRQLAEKPRVDGPPEPPMVVPDEKNLIEESWEPSQPLKREVWAVPFGLALLMVLVVLFFMPRKPADKPTTPDIPGPSSRGESGVKREPREKTATAVTDDRKVLRSLDHAHYEWRGDFDKMLTTRKIRVLLPHSRTLYFNDKGRERGLMGETIRDFERYLNRKYAKVLDHRPLTVFIIPEKRDALLKGVSNGLGDIAAGDITVTESRQKLVDFVAPKELPPVSEILVSGPNSPPVTNLNDLAGKTVHVRKDSSYYESLISLNERFKQDGQVNDQSLLRSLSPRRWHDRSGGKPAIKIISVPEALEDEDLLEMLNAGIIDFLVVDSWMAKLWAPVLSGIKVREDIVLRRGGRIGWAIRKNSPKLAAEIQDFYRNYVKKLSIREVRLAQFHKRIKQIKNPTSTTEMNRFERTIALFDKYGQMYKFDPLMLVAQGYQESALDHQKRSPVGAIGIMQIMPKTGASMKVGDIKLMEPNIHAGAKYMDNLITRYFKGTNFNEQERNLFAFASYNAGPGNISAVRKLAARRGLDPNKWFNNVEVVSTERIGFETTTYVRNIYKYYVAYKLMLKNTVEKEKARGHFSEAKKDGS